VSIANNIHAKAVELGKHVLNMTTAAGSGHPSSALALSHIVVELMYRRMRYDPADAWNPASDRLVLSIGHAVPIIYAAYADLGGAVGSDRDHAQRLGVEDLSDLRELSSVLDGHPNPAEGFPFFDAATGSLGQGLSVGAGLALAARLDGLDKEVFVLAGDGEAREGQFWEAADFIVDHRLTSVCLIVSCNEHGQAGPVSPQQSAEAIAAKAAAFGWDVADVDGHDPDELSAALEKVGTGDKPTAIVARTVKGWGVDLMLGKNFHGKPVPGGDLARACAELDATGARLGATAGEAMAPQPPQRVPVEVASPPSIVLPAFEVAAKRVDMGDAVIKRKLATRVAYGIALVALGDADSRIVSLDGDVSNSTYANLFAREHPHRFFECKIAEQNMISAAAGLAATGKIPFASSFAKFLARATDQIDMASITRANIKIVGSHSGVSLGADGPSQMSMADLAYFRSMTKADSGGGAPVCRLFQPCDAISAYRCVELMANVEGMCYLRTHRPTADFVYSDDEQFQLGGCKQLRTGGHLTVVSSGFILHTALKAVEQLSAQGINCNVFDAYTFPFDATPILETARNSGRVILTVEDNYVGGLHGEIAEAAAEHGDIRVHGMTVRRMPKSARTADEVFSYVGVGLAQIVEKATALARP
jgi:transketolase